MTDTWNVDGDGYFGHVMTGAVISSIPLIANIDVTTIEGRAILSLSGGLGALIATFGDRPKSYQDAVARIAGGVSSCFLFAPWIAERFNLNGDMNGMLLVFGVIGVLSWYVIGSVSRGLAAMRDSGSLWRAILVALRQQLPQDKIQNTPPPEANKDGDAKVD